MLNPDGLTDVDRAILEMLDDGRVTVPYVEDETGYSSEYIRARLTRLREHGHVARVYRGLYQLVDDPRSDNGEGPEGADQ
jgi:predicted transcriptional regulator of viral defense system